MSLSRLASMSALRSFEGLSVAACAIPARHVLDRVRNQFLENRRVQVRQSLEIQARLTHLVLSQLGQSRFLLSSVGDNIDNEFAPAYGKAREAHLTCSSALVGVANGAVADNARPP